MLELAWLIPGFPLLGALLNLAVGRRLGEPSSGWLAAAASGASFVTTVLVFNELRSLEAGERFHIEKLFDWITVGSFDVDAGLLIDPLSITMALFITGVGSLIHVYSVGYMHGDANFSKFFIYLNLFVTSMLLLVLGDNLLLTFLGWEGVGACSYLLISFWFTDKANATAGKKAFVTNRVGDFGYMLALFLVFESLGSIKYDDIVAGASTLAPVTATAIVLLFLLAATGKSAQLPLFVWLPDAMAGPTPVSALIHAATMVTSGVFLLTRLNPILAEAQVWALGTIAWVGAITALVAATAAVAQNDIKKVLAYSTVSQLGYLFLAIGSGGYVPALFHMITHAFFKALLFLGAGSVIHGMHHEQDMRKMGGLRKLMPITSATFIVGWLAIAGVPPFSGFWSKDEILLYAYNADAVGGKALWVIGLATALITAFYMTRQVLMTFFGKPRFSEDVHPHESPKTMTTPLIVLAGLAAVAGLLNLPFKGMHYLQEWLEPSLFGNEVHLDASSNSKILLALIATLVAVSAILMARKVYGTLGTGSFVPASGSEDEGKPMTVAQKIEKPILARAWGIDEAYSRLFGQLGEKLFHKFASFDRSVIDGAVNGVSKLASGVGTTLRVTQTGYVRNYLQFMAFGVIALGVWLLWRLFI